MVDLDSYDIILINTSAGKDSQAMLDYVVQLARDKGVADRLVAVHCDLGRVEWEGTRELAAAQAKHYGVRFEVVARDRDLLHQIEYERRKFPDAARRYCTSDQKTSQVTKLITRLVKEFRDENDWRPSVQYRATRVLNCLGIRADESPARAKKPAIAKDKASNTRRHVTRWLPIHTWTVAQVWERIRTSGVPHHRAYDLGMPRLSCCFCVLASKPALVLAAKHNPELAQEYLRVERAINHSFRAKMSIAEIIELAREDTELAMENWSA